MQPEHQHDANYRIFMRIRGMASEGAQRTSDMPACADIEPNHYQHEASQPLQPAQSCS